MYIWTGLVFSKELEDRIRDVCREVNDKYNLDTLSFTLPQHISIKSSFYVDNYIEVKNYIKEILNDQVEFQIDIIGITKINNGVIWLDIKETPQLRSIHNLLNVKLKEKYNIPLNGFDGDMFHFHSTLFQDSTISDEHIALVDELNNGLEFPITTTINMINIGISEIGSVGTYTVTDSITLKGDGNSNRIVLTSCGIINEDFKSDFYQLIAKDELRNKKVLYITTAADGEIDDDKSWMDTEYQTILDLGIDKNNIVEYKIGKSNIGINDFDVMYMMGGNTFYLLDVIRKTEFDKEIVNFINNGKIYIGSSAGSEILGNSIEPALGYDDNNVGMKDFTGLKIIDGLVIPHCNRKQKFVEQLEKHSSEKLFLLYDEDGIIVRR